MISLLLCFLYIVCGIILSTVTAQAPPFYEKPNQYSFDSTGRYMMKLTDLVCVKENNPRSFKFQMRTNSQSYPDGTMIGMYDVVDDDDDVGKRCTNSSVLTVHVIYRHRCVPLGLDGHSRSCDNIQH
jgi:hypothetical protein